MSHRRVRIAHQNRDVVIGACRLPRHAPVGLKLADFLHAKAAYPSSPAACDFTGAAMPVLSNIEGNDQYGDCVFAENAHFVGVMTGNANTLFAYTLAQTLADYTAETGFDPTDPNTDQGADPITDLNFWTQRPLADGTKVAGWALVDASNKAEVQYAISEFGNLKMWFGIPDSIVNSMPTGDGFVWDVSAGDSDPNNGHCIGSYAYGSKAQIVSFNADGVIIATWGMIGLVTWPALAKWFVASAGGGLAVRVTTDWVSNATGQTPSGLNLAALITAFNMYFGGSIPVPDSPPPPIPPPVPVPNSGVGPSLWQVQAAEQAALMGAPHALLTRSQATGIALQALPPLWQAP